MRIYYVTTIITFEIIVIYLRQFYIMSIWSVMVNTDSKTLKVIFHIIPIVGWVLAPSYAVVAATLSLYSFQDSAAV